MTSTLNWKIYEIKKPSMTGVEQFPIVDGFFASCQFPLAPLFSIVPVVDAYCHIKRVLNAEVRLLPAGIAVMNFLACRSVLAPGSLDRLSRMELEFFLLLG